MVRPNNTRRSRWVAQAAVWAFALLAAAPAAAQSIELAWDPSPETDIVRYRVYIGKASNTYTETHEVSAPRTTFSFLTPVPGVRYYFAVAAVNSANVESPRSNEVSGVSGVDVTPPAVAITSPGAATTVSTATISVSGIASDSAGVTQVTWANDRGGSGTASGTTSWSIASVPLQSGVNVITVTAKDAALNTRQASVAVTYSATDTVRPTIAITTPTNATTVDTATIGLVGTASDNVGITRITWRTSAGATGIAIGTNAWAVANIPLESGANVVTAVAHDAAGNTSEASISVTYRAETTSSSDSALLDTFTGVSGTALTAHAAEVRPANSAWVLLQSGTVSLQSGRARIGSSASYVIAAHESGTANGTIRAQFSSSSVTPFAGIVLRAVDASRLLLLRYSRGYLGLFRRVDKEFVRVAQVPVTPAVPGVLQRLEARLDGPRIQAVWNGTVVFESALNDYLSATKHGLLWYGPEDASAAFDNFEVRTSSSGTTETGGTSDPQGNDSGGSTLPDTPSEPTVVVTEPGFGVIDAFTAADGTPLVGHAADVRPANTGWLEMEQGSARMRGGRVRLGNAANYAVVVHESGLANGTVGTDLTSTSTSAYGGIVFRVVDANRMLLLRYSRGYVGLFRRASREFYRVNEVAVAPTAPGSIHRLEARLNGQQVEARWDGEVLFTAAIADYQSATKHGLLWNAPSDPDAEFDNFEVRPLNGGPTIAALSDQRSAEGDVVSLVIPASDPQNRPLSYAVSGLPSGLSVNLSTGVISGTIQSGSAGTYTPTVTVSNGLQTVSRSLMWTVVSASGATRGVLDSFTDSDGTPLVVHSADAKPMAAAWAQLEGGSGSLVHGRVRAGAASEYAIAVHESGTADGSVAVDLTSSSAAPYGGIVLRALDARRMLVLRYTSWNGRGYLGLFRRVNGEFMMVQQVAVPSATPGAILRLEARMTGSRVEAVLNGVVRFVSTVTDYQSATKHGLLWHAPTDPAARFDNFQVRP